MRGAGRGSAILAASAGGMRVTMDDAVYHTTCVARGAMSALVIADMPF
ncbi:MAG TPA: 3-methyl-2-oxobutanoate hydroxymethyltransferase [Casimicrobiaceae bacterium]|nr:3-methyl-2-oxobutanoate hydroxymethyltransferase [Casimicrobiaceae bacterium]